MNESPPHLASFTSACAISFSFGWRTESAQSHEPSSTGSPIPQGVTVHVPYHDISAPRSIGSTLRLNAQVPFRYMPLSRYRECVASALFGGRSVRDPYESDNVTTRRNHYPASPDPSSPHALTPFGVHCGLGFRVRV